MAERFKAPSLYLGRLEEGLAGSNPVPTAVFKNL